MEALETTKHSVAAHSDRSGAKFRAFACYLSHEGIKEKTVRGNEGQERGDGSRLAHLQLDGEWHVVSRPRDCNPHTRHCWATGMATRLGYIMCSTNTTEISDYTHTKLAERRDTPTDQEQLVSRRSMAPGRSCGVEVRGRWASVAMTPRRPTPMARMQVFDEALNAEGWPRRSSIAENTNEQRQLHIADGVYDLSTTRKELQERP